VGVDLEAEHGLDVPPGVLHRTTPGVRQGRDPGEPVLDLLAQHPGKEVHHLVGRARLHGAFGQRDDRPDREAGGFEARERRALPGTVDPHHRLEEVPVGHLAWPRAEATHRQHRVEHLPHLGLAVGVDEGQDEIHVPGLESASGRRDDRPVQ
jgi:hypothetical protein